MKYTPEQIEAWRKESERIDFLERVGFTTHRNGRGHGPK